MWIETIDGDTDGNRSESSPTASHRSRARRRLDDVRTALMMEPRGHSAIYGALLVEPDDPSTDMGVLLIHDDGYSTMRHVSSRLGLFSRRADGRTYTVHRTDTRRSKWWPVRNGTVIELTGSHSRTFHFVFPRDRSVGTPGEGSLHLYPNNDNRGGVE